MREIIEKWMRRVVEEQLFSQFPDLHVDQIDPELKVRDRWFPGALRALETAMVVRNDNRWPVTVAVGISLTSGSAPMGVNFGNLNEVEEHFEWTPPSLYMFPLGEEPWKDEDCTELSSEYRASSVPEMHTYFCEWYDKNDAEFRRSLWLTSDGAV